MRRWFGDTHSGVAEDSTLLRPHDGCHLPAEKIYKFKLLVRLKRVLKMTL